MKKFIALMLLLVALVSFAPQKQLKWMAIGDSITFHNNNLNTTKGMLTKGYMDRVMEKLPYVKFANHGHPGWTAQGIAENFDNLHIEKADVYTIFLGTNDWWVGLPTGTMDDYNNATGNKTVYGAYRTMLDKIRSLNADAKIILMTPLQRTDFIDVNNVHSIIHGSYRPNRQGVMLSAYADAIKDIAEKQHVTLVDLYYKSGITVKNAVKYKRLRNANGQYQNYPFPKYIDLPFNPDKDEYPYPADAIDWTYDGLHPSDKGHQKIADMLVKVMKTY